MSAIHTIRLAKRTSSFDVTHVCLETLGNRIGLYVRQRFRLAMSGEIVQVANRSAARKVRLRPGPKAADTRNSLTHGLTARNTRRVAEKIVGGKSFPGYRAHHRDIRRRSGHFPRSVWWQIWWQMRRESRRLSSPSSSTLNCLDKSEPRPPTPIPLFQIAHSRAVLGPTLIDRMDALDRAVRIVGSRQLEIPS